MSKPGEVLLSTWSGLVHPEWVDYNHHLNDAYYLVVFSYATEGLMAEIGMDAAGRAATGQTIYTLEVHLNYILEVREGVAIGDGLVGGSHHQHRVGAAFQCLQRRQRDGRRGVAAHGFQQHGSGFGQPRTRLRDAHNLPCLWQRAKGEFVLGGQVALRQNFCKLWRQRGGFRS